MKNFFNVLAMIFVIMIGMSSCSTFGGGDSDSKLKDAFKEIEANLFDSVHFVTQIYCKIPAGEQRQESIDEMSRDVFQRSVADGSPYILYIHCIDEVADPETQWGVPVTLPEVDTAYILDTGWTPGDCPSKHSDYLCD